jgi:hypothetical protein
MARELFQVVGFDQGGINGEATLRSLVCETDSGGKLAIWGQEAPTREMANIEAVLQAGVPCTVECECEEPAEWATDFGHTHWVEQNSVLKVISR